MKKIALLLVAVLCFGILAGCGASYSVTPTADGVGAYVELTANENDMIILGVNADQKVLTVSYGFAGETSSAVPKEESAFKDLDLAGKSFDEAIDAVLTNLDSLKEALGADIGKLTFKVRQAKDGNGKEVVSGSADLVKALETKLSEKLAQHTTSAEIKEVGPEGNESTVASAASSEPTASQDAPTSSDTRTSSGKNTETAEIDLGDNTFVDD